MGLDIQRPSLWKHVRRWDRLAAAGAPTARLASGPLVVLDADLANQVMTSRDAYEDASPFYRTRSRSPLPRPVRAELTRAMLAAIGAHALATPALVPAETPGGGPQRLRRFAWGADSLRKLFAPVIASDRAPALDRLVDVFVREKVIGDDLSGRLRRMPEGHRDQVFRQTGALVRSMRPNPSPVDLVDVVAPLSRDLPPLEVGELYLRLTHSLVAFTGTALEWAALLAAEEPGFASAARESRPLRPFLLEAQRLYPSTWRLVRRAATSHEIGGHETAPGEAVVIAVATLHRHHRHWDRPHAFDPTRWLQTEAEQRRAYLPFGRGKGVCPGREVALDAVERLLTQLYRTHDVVAKGARGRRPYVRGAMGTPRRTLVACPRAGAAAGPQHGKPSGVGSADG